MELLLTPARTTSLSSPATTTTTLLSSSNLHHHNSFTNFLVRSFSVSSSDDDDGHGTDDGIFLSPDIIIAHENIQSWYSHQIFLSSPHKMSVLPVTSSGPMVIPTRGLSRSRQNQPPRNYKHAGVPPAVAALLAVTSIPSPSARRQRALRQRQQAALDIFVRPPTPSDDVPLSFDDALGESLGLESVPLSRDPSRDSARSTLSALLGPPDYYEESSLQKSPSESQLSVRSDSSDSVPSLEDDDRSTFSWSSFQSLPLSRRRSGGDPRARILASPSEECHFDHPLMFDSDEDVVIPTLEPELGFFSEDALKRVTRRLNFKSNLTASIRVLKSAARSFSSISVAAPFTQPDDYLTRSILSITPQFTDEKRPAPTLDAPTPALRRYLNPTNAFPDSPCTGAIQMQTYSTSLKPDADSDERDASGAAPHASYPTARPREVRENGDFLRVIVLEMNMRRGGKLSDTAHGKAKLILPPRQPCKYRTLGDIGRWEAWVCIYDE